MRSALLSIFAEEETSSCRLELDESVEERMNGGRTRNLQQDVSIISGKLRGSRNTNSTDFQEFSTHLGIEGGC